MGETVPEFDAWLEDSKNDAEFRRKWREEHYEGELFEDEEEGFFEDEDDGLVEENEEEFKPSSLPVVRSQERIGRNDPCPCGSGRKFKKCCYGKTKP